MKLKNIVWVGVLSLGCAEDVGSENIRTQGMYAKYTAIASGNGETSITAELRVGGNNGTFVQLGGEDELSASSEDDDVVLAHDSVGDRHYYEGDLEGDAEGLEIQVAFTRGEDFDDAVDSFAELPAPFEAELEDPDADAISRDEDVAVVWDNETSGTMKWTVEGDCIETESGTTSDDGTLVIEAEDIEVWDLDAGESCEVTITLDRVEEGDVDPTFEEGGKFVAIQRRTVTFTSTPGEDEEEDD